MLCLCEFQFAWKVNVPFDDINEDRICSNVDPVSYFEDLDIHCEYNPTLNTLSHFTSFLYLCTIDIHIIWHNYDISLHNRRAYLSWASLRVLVIQYLHYIYRTIYTRKHFPGFIYRQKEIQTIVPQQIMYGQHHQKRHH